MGERAEDRRRRVALFLSVSVAAHLAIAGLFGMQTGPRELPPAADRAVPLALFSPGPGAPGVAAAQEPSPSSATPSAPATPRGRRGSAARADDEVPRATPTQAGAGEPAGDPLSNDAFLDGLMAGSGPRRPQPGACPDPVVGTWRARRFDPEMGKQAEFLLRVRERSGDALRGTITLRAWSGRTPSPPRCAPGAFFHTVRMPARGSYDDDGRLRLDALSFTRVSHCDDPDFEYNLDHFTGQVRGDELRAVNNDGGHEVDTPYTFERIACH